MMRKLQLGAAGGVFFLIATLSGCGGGYYAGVTYGPPAPLVETPYGMAPGPGYIWTPGYYDWAGGAYAWRRGTWRRPPHSVDRWVSPNWEHRGNGYRYHEGGWQHGNHFHH